MKIERFALGRSVSSPRITAPGQSRLRIDRPAANDSIKDFFCPPRPFRPAELEGLQDRDLLRPNGGGYKVAPRVLAPDVGTENS